MLLYVMSVLLYQSLMLVSLFVVYFVGCSYSIVVSHYILFVGYDVGVIVIVSVIHIVMLLCMVCALLISLVALCLCRC